MDTISEGGAVRPEVSIVIPVYNEEENIIALAAEVDKALKDVTFQWECLWVDDGSTDNTPDLVKKITKQNPCHKLVRLDGNFGQSAAMYTGFRLSAGEIIVTLDGDGQNDPADIPMLVSTLVSRNADLVNGVRKKRQDSWIRKISSRIANGFRNWMTNESVTDVGCSIRAFRSRFTEDLPLFAGMHRFLPTLMRLNGCRKIVEVPVNHRPRKAGKSKYGIHNRLWVGIADTFGVKWYMKRAVRPRVKSES